MKAVILAGGLGSRISEQSIGRPNFWNIVKVSSKGVMKTTVRFRISEHQHGFIIDRVRAAVKRAMLVVIRREADASGSGH